ncbi:RagB/SusD family nutrient uptake outer membrane protein [Chryseolinea lacunae]|uniref:RagB/SusD family nutrient uptake outer membrane protein n=1 Tax=Chryseolinea lacunae TaxID=2801331 RepID=A0ABS1L188_9BACT|nr:RagB/SusD family nutrient uptake outer membrane protein [Chryseolinea lacunae]MBL0745292.1 RagB/SusD family nutrient uptake outer membrane protein [Chryseolinea lacunae]
MKKKFSFKRYIAPLALVGALACQDLEEKPQGFVSTDNFYATIEQGEAALTASMNALWEAWAPGYSYGYGNFIYDDQLLDGDMVIPSDFGGSLWDQHYKALNNVNGVLRAIKRGNFEGIAQDEIDGLEAQARFLRAYNYFALVRLFGDLPLITEDTPDPVISPIRQRTPIADVYELIVSDFQYAVETLPQSWPGAPGKPAKAAAKGLLAKVYLTMATSPLNKTENYAKARDMAADLMDDGTNSLIENVGDVFKPENKYGPEVMWGFNSTSDDPATDAHIWTPEIMDGWGDASIDPTWSDEWLKTPEPRQDAYLILEFDGTPYTEFDEQRPFVRKFTVPYISQDEYENGQTTANLPIIRYADVLLIYAEAANMANGSPTPEAYEAINQVRRRAHNLPINTPDASVDLSGLSKDQFDDAVIQERNVELSFEYDRWFDIIRKRLLVKINTLPHPDYLPNITDDDYLYPIPTYDARILGSQNPGYTSE